MKNRQRSRHSRKLQPVRKRFRLDGRSNDSRADTPKSARPRPVLGPVTALVDPIGTLGHPPRGRKGARPRHRCPHRRLDRILEERLAADAGITRTHRCRDCGRVTLGPVR